MDIIRYVNIFIRGVFRTLSNIYDRVFQQKYYFHGKAPSQIFDRILNAPQFMVFEQINKDLEKSFL